MPYYKWSFRAMRQLPVLSMEAELLEYLLMSDNDAAAQEKAKVINGIIRDIIEETGKQGLVQEDCSDAGKCAYLINIRIEDAELRNLHILAAY